MLYADDTFNNEMRSLIEGKPAGRLVVLTLEDILERISNLEGRLAALEAKLAAE